MPESKIVDAWALMAWIQNEQPGADQLQKSLLRAEEGSNQLSMSWINTGEVYYMLVRKRGRKIAEEFLTRLPSLPIRLIIPNEDDILLAARLKSKFRLSYADSFAVGLAIKESATVITGDPEIRDMRMDELRVEWIGELSRE